MTDGQRSVPLRVVLLAALFVLLFGLLVKLPCASGDWGDGRAYRRFCYTDIVPLYQSERLAEGKFPYLQAPNEYPVGTGLVMALTAAAVGTNSDFFLANVALLSAAALVTAVLLYRLVGARALWFVLAPTLLLYAFLNWDLVPATLATAGTYAYLRRRDALAGLLIGLGAVAKVFPALLLFPFVLGRLREGRRREAWGIAGGAGATLVAFNLPFALANYRNWSLFFRFNAARPIDWGTVWFVGCRWLAGRASCRGGAVVNLLILALLVAGAVLVWRLRAARDPGFPRWTFGFPLVALLLLTTKVYSPQYSLWLLPWFALAFPDIRLFLAFEAADVAVFFTEFSWVGRGFGFGGLPAWPMELAVLARAAVLVACVVAWVRRSPLRADALSPPAVRLGAEAA